MNFPQEIEYWLELFDHFKTEGSTISQNFAWWNKYGTVVIALLQFIKADRTSDWQFHPSATDFRGPIFR